MKLKKMEKIIKKNLNEHLRVFNNLNETHFHTLCQFAKLIIKNLSKNGRIFLIGNGGSAADCQHFAAEMMVKFEKKRKAIPFISLTTDTSVLTACSNDFNFDQVFLRQISAHFNKNDVLIAFSTSGRSKNIINALKYIKKKNMLSLVFTGSKKNTLIKYTPHIFKAPSNSVSRIQEIHIFCIHIICCLIEKKL